MIITGHYQFPEKAAKVAAHLDLNDSVAEFQLSIPDQLSQVYALSLVVVSQPLGSIPRTIALPDGGRFVPNDNAVFVAWLKKWQKPSVIERIERNKWTVLAVLIVTVLFSILLVREVFPRVAKMVAAAIPIEAQVFLGENTQELLDQNVMAPTALPVQRQTQLQMLFQQITPEELRNDPLPIKLVFRSHKEGANAFTLADGSIVVTDELVALAKNDQQLAAVMLHEMGHHRHRHVLQLVTRASLLSFASLWLSGDNSGAVDFLANSSVVLLALSYSREMELEADQFAITQMKRQHLPLSAMSEIFNQLQEDQRIRRPARFSLLSWLSTHPDMQERLQKIKEAE